MIKGSIQEDVIVNIYAPDRAPQYVRRMWTDVKGETDRDPVVMGDLAPCFNQGQII